MRPTRLIPTLALSLAVGSCGMARAGAPQPDTRRGDFAHVCNGGSAKGLPCTVPTQDADCPGSSCVLVAQSNLIKGTLTLIAHDGVTDWANGATGNQALTVMLEVKGPDRKLQLLAATYQNLASPTEPPTATSNVISIAMDESAVQALAVAVNGLLFASPESAVVAHLQALFGASGTPALVAISDRRVQSADHTSDALATVLRFKVKLQFLTPA